MTVTLHHVEDGPADGRPIVLGSSLGTTTAMWDPQVSGLAGRHRVIRYDHRGHGGSPTGEGPVEIADLGRDVLDLLDRLDIERAVVGGISLGGMVSMWLAAHAPERVERLIVCASSARLGPPEGWYERAAAVRQSGMATVADAVLGRWFTPDYAAAHPGVLEEMRTMLESTSVDGYAACCEAIARMDLVPDLGRITAPTLVVAGTADPATPPDHAERIVAAIPDATMAVVPAAHLLSIERAPEVTALVLAHLDAPAAVQP